LTTIAPANESGSAIRVINEKDLQQSVVTAGMDATAFSVVLKVERIAPAMPNAANTIMGVMALGKI